MPVSTGYCLPNRTLYVRVLRNTDSPPASISLTCSETSILSNDSRCWCGFMNRRGMDEKEWRVLCFVGPPILWLCRRFHEMRNLSIAFSDSDSTITVTSSSLKPTVVHRYILAARDTYGEHIAVNSGSCVGATEIISFEPAWVISV